MQDRSVLLKQISKEQEPGECTQEEKQVSFAIQIALAQAEISVLMPLHWSENKNSSPVLESLNVLNSR